MDGNRGGYSLLDFGFVDVFWGLVFVVFVVERWCLKLLFCIKFLEFVVLVGIEGVVIEVWKLFVFFFDVCIWGFVSDFLYKIFI